MVAEVPERYSGSWSRRTLIWVLYEGAAAHCSGVYFVVLCVQSVHVQARAGETAGVFQHCDGEYGWTAADVCGSLYPDVLQSAVSQLLTGDAFLFLRDQYCGGRDCPPFDPQISAKYSQKGIQFKAHSARRLFKSGRAVYRQNSAESAVGIQCARGIGWQYCQRHLL